MRRFIPSGWKTAPVAVLAVIVMAVGALAFPPGNAGDTVADNVLGQPDFIHNAANIPDANTLDMTVNLSGFVAVDKSNHVYVADSHNNRVLGYSSLGALSNGQAASVVIGQPDFFSTRANQGVTPNAGTLNVPTGVAVDSANNLYVADFLNNRVLIYFTPFTKNASIPGSGDGIADVVIGQNGDFAAKGCNSNSSPGPDTLCGPQGLALDASDNLWVADQTNNRVLEYYSPIFNSSANFVLGQPDFFHNLRNQGTTPSGSTLSGPTAVSADSHNNIYVADELNSRVLEYNTPLASGNNIANHVWGQGGLTTGTCNNGGLSAASLCNPTGVALDSSNNVYIVDATNDRILEYNEGSNPPANFTANHVFGQGGSFTLRTCNTGGLSATSLCSPEDVATSGSFLLATDISNNRVLVYNTPLTSQTANVVLGQPDFVHNAANSVDAEAMDNAAGVAIDSSNRLYVADFTNNRVLGFSNATNFANDAPATLVIGQPDFFHNLRNQGGAPSAATLFEPESVATDSSGNLYVADLGNNRVLEYNAPFSQGKTQGFTANRVYGQSGSFISATCNLGGLSAISLCTPRGLAVDTHNNLYVADQSNSRVLEYPNGSTTAATVFGQGTAGTSFTTNTCNNGGVSASALCQPAGVATDSNNNVYVADWKNNRVLEFNETANPPTNFSANTVFGQAGSFATAVCNQGGVSANGLCNPHKLIVDSQSNLYVSDSANNRILEYKTPLVSGTTASRVFGQADNFSTNLCNVGNAGPNSSSLCGPIGVALDTSQDLMVGDFTNNRVVKYLQPLAKPGAVTLTPNPVAFGNIAQHNTSVTRTVTATIAGNVPVLFTGSSITGTNAADFKVVSNTCQGYVKGGSACAVGVAFTPSAAVGTAESATLSLFDNGSNSPQTDSLTGTSSTQTSLSPASIGFGNVPHGTTSTAQSTTLTNNQSAAISLSPAPNISAGSPTFKISSTTCGGSVAAFASCTISVTCSPASATPFTGTLTVTDSPDSLSPHNISLSCTGT